MSMKTTKETERDMLGVIHRSVEGLHRIGLVDEATMREFDEGCLAPAEGFTPADLKALREREGASQAVLARHLGVATATVGQWERGQRKPVGPAVKLLSLVKAKGLEYIS
ncbi:DNA-binding transcriptional regulator [soil metagenome]